MADFHQSGKITTLHRLGRRHFVEIEEEITGYARESPIALILPVLASEMDGDALSGILNELRTVTYLNEIVITLGRTDEWQFERAKKVFSKLPGEKMFIWNDGPRIRELYKLLEEREIPAGNDGKGRSVWMAFGYIIASQQSEVIVLHDCDIISYQREILARLVYPVVNPSIEFEFCKGYYSRVTDRLHGRVTRLFVFPLLGALLDIFPGNELLLYLNSFRYPLAGEFCMLDHLARRNRIPGDWGLEIGVLAEVYRNASLKNICQVDLCDNYEHKHQPLSKDNPKTGLLKMSIDIAKSLFRNLASLGVVITEGQFRTLKAAYLRTAQDYIVRYQHDASINGLLFDRHEEAVATEAFAKGLNIAIQQFLDDPLDAPLIPNWNRVIAAIPEFFDLLRESVNKDSCNGI